MKRSLKVLAVVLVLVLVAAILVACGGPKGTYKESILGLNSYTFSGSRYTFELGNIETSGTYKISKNERGDKIIIFTSSEGNETTCLYSEGEQDGEKYIKIDGIKYVLEK